MNARPFEIAGSTLLLLENGIDLILEDLVLECVGIDLSDGQKRGDLTIDVASLELEMERRGITIFTLVRLKRTRLLSPR